MTTLLKDPSTAVAKEENHGSKVVFATTVVMLIVFGVFVAKTFIGVDFLSIAKNPVVLGALSICSLVAFLFLRKQAGN